MRLTRTRAWVGGTVAACLLLTTAAWFLLIGPQREEASSLREQVTATQSQNALLATRVDALAQQFADLPSQEAELSRLRASVPQEARLPELIRQVSALAVEAGVSLDTITPGQPAPVTSAATGTTTAAAGVDGLLQVPLTLVASGSFPRAQAYLSALQQELPRALLVTGLTVARDGETAGDVTLSVTAAVFVLPGKATADPAATATDLPTTTAAAATTSSEPSL